MIDRIVVNDDRTYAIVVYFDGTCVSLYHSKGHVMFMLDWFLAPIDMDSNLEYLRDMEEVA